MVFMVFTLKKEFDNPAVPGNWLLNATTQLDMEGLMTRVLHYVRIRNYLRSQHQTAIIP